MGEGKDKGVAPGKLWPDALGKGVGTARDRTWSHAWGDGTAAPPHAAGPSVPGFLCRALPGAPGWSCICHSRQ